MAEIRIWIDLSMSVCPSSVLASQDIDLLLILSEMILMQNIVISLHFFPYTLPYITLNFQRQYMLLIKGQL